MALQRLCFTLPPKHSRSLPSEAARKLTAIARRSLHWFFTRRSRLRLRRRRVESSRFEDTAGVDPASSADKVSTTAPRIYSYAELYIGTSGFSDAELLGSGGFGRVYRAVLPSDGTVAAVKCVAPGRGAKTFAAELTAVAQLRHRNLVRLRGWCIHGAEQLLLVYDYLPNRSLDRHLFASSPLGWERRRRVIEGLAAALFYLHEELDTQIIHRDVKASNVMLDAGFNARLGDFGLARWLEHDDEPPRSDNPPFRISETSRMGGTLGYLPPEGFRRSGAATAKSDVFGFGIVVLEVATGRRAVDLAALDDETFMLDSVRRLADEGRCLEAGDHRLPDGSFPLSEMRRLIHLGLLCSLNDPHARPTMKWVMAVLAGDYAGKLPILPSFQGHPQYHSLSSATTSTTITASSDFVTTGGATVFLTADDGSGGSSEDNKTHRHGTPPTLVVVDTPHEIPFDEIVALTDGFSESRVVEKLDFGKGYEGFLEKRFRVLVKRLEIGLCPTLRARFCDELRNLARLRHRHLVQLRGWSTGRGEMLVVYDYSSGAPLSHHLFRSRDASLLTWRQRYTAVKALASAVLYLHEEQVVHRNITSAAVHIGPDMSPRLGCFALAEFLTKKEHYAAAGGQGATRFIFGYMSPEYMESGEATAAADVYGFGVVVLEVVTGLPAVDFRSPEVLLVRRARGLKSRRRAAAEVADVGLQGKFEEREVERLVRLGMACTLSEATARPSMREVSRVLDGDDELLERMMGGVKEERREEWEGRNATALSLVRKIQAVGVY